MVLILQWKDADWMNKFRSNMQQYVEKTKKKEKAHQENIQLVSERIKANGIWSQEGLATLVANKIEFKEKSEYITKIAIKGIITPLKKRL